MSSPLVDIVGMLAGAVWMSAAFYFQMIRHDLIDPGYVAALFLIGLSLMLSSSAIAIMDTALATTLAVLGQALMLFVGLGAWWVLDRSAVLKKQQDPDHYDDASEA